MKGSINNNKCYARYCDNNNIDCTCMYGNASEMTCQVNCYNCIHNCKKNSGDIACKKFTKRKWNSCLIYGGKRWNMINIYSSGSISIDYRKLSDSGEYLGSVGNDSNLSTEVKNEIYESIRRIESLLNNADSK